MVVSSTKANNCALSYLDLCMYMVIKIQTFFLLTKKTALVWSRKTYLAIKLSLFSYKVGAERIPIKLVDPLIFKEGFFYWLPSSPN